MRNPVFPLFWNNRILESNRIAGRTFSKIRNHSIILIKVIA